MRPSVHNVQEAIPVFIAALLSDNVFLVNNLLDKFPKLIQLKDKRNRNVLMMAVYGKPAIPKDNQVNVQLSALALEPSKNHNVISYLISFYVIASPKLDIYQEDEDGFTAYDWAVLGGNEFAVSLISKLTANDGYGN